MSITSFNIPKKDKKSCSELMTQILIPMLGFSIPTQEIEILNKDDYCSYFIPKYPILKKL
jgi:hypothetical protein